MRITNRYPSSLPGQEHLEWQLILDTMDPNGFLAEPRKFASGDDVDLGGRASLLVPARKRRASSGPRGILEETSRGISSALSAEEERARRQ